MFEGQTLLIATNHGKEQVIAPVLEHALGVQCTTLTDFDTDIFGTFSGEIERKDDPITTAKNKCKLAFQQSNCSLIVASEGCFGPHPSFYFLSADEEYLVFIDLKNDLEIVVKETSLETNFNGKQVQTKKELDDFAKAAKFPSHALIIRKEKDDHTHVVKGINQEEVLLQTFNTFITLYGSAFVETDMRAMLNPTRMKVIESAALKLAEKINARCPICQTPGFGITHSKPGLPCQLCHFPTYSTLSHIYSCTKCKHSEEVKHPHGKHFEDPTYCNMCNP